jgi:hypothetical protein
MDTSDYIDFYAWNYADGQGRIEVDWVLLRGYAEPEPVAVVGEEEAADTEIQFEAWVWRFKPLGWDGYGYYEFYSVATDRAGNKETGEQVDVSYK